MSKSEAAKVAARLQGANGSVWEDEALASRVAEVVHATVVEALNAHRADSPLHEQADAQQEIDELRRERDEARARVDELEPLLAASPCPNPTEHEALATAYVAHEVPWSDVAAGMMTIARDGTPWMVRHWNDGEVLLVNGQRTFDKAPAEGETVRVLVPYVTPEQAEALVASELGGRA